MSKGGGKKGERKEEKGRGGRMWGDDRRWLQDSYSPLAELLEI